MSDIEVFDPRFAELAIGHARLERLWIGVRWAEGPVYMPAAKSLLRSDIPDDRMRRLEQYRISLDHLRDSNPMKSLSVISWSEFAKAESAPDERVLQTSRTSTIAPAVPTQSVLTCFRTGPSDFDWM